MKKQFEQLYAVLEKHNITDINNLIIIKKKNPKKQSKNHKPWSYALYRKVKCGTKFITYLEPKVLNLIRDLGVKDGEQ